ncbi:hypothetical protein DFH29DRAFT_813911 [Suillus ampliporus]|nr:hypothetical protein DFH29DRAFT_813911 [Suillus ampliporus]
MLTSETRFNSITYSRKTTEESVTITIPDRRCSASPPESVATTSTVPPVYCTPTSAHRDLQNPSLLHASVSPGLVAPQLATFTPHVPRPDELHPPPVGASAQGYYVVTVGQEVGIFFHWLDCHARVTGITNAAHTRYDHWAEALAVYTRHHRAGLVRAIPTVGGPFWPSVDEENTALFSSPTPFPSPTPSDASNHSGSDNEFWSYLEDLSEQMSQVAL